MSRAVFLAIALACFGCAGSLEQSRAQLPEASDVAYCRRLDSRAATWGAIGKGAVVLSSGAGLSTLPIDPDDKTLRLSVAGASLAFAALSVAALYASDAYAESWARDCTPKPQAPPLPPARTAWDEAPDCLTVLLGRFAAGSTCAETQLAVNADDRCRADFPGGVRLDCEEWR